MKWRDKLKQGERSELERAVAMREQARTLCNETMRKLKKRCESRMRAEIKGTDDAK